MSAPATYAEAAPIYLAAHWSPLPLPARKKAEPPKGFTGTGAPDVTEVNIAVWSADPTNVNLCIRMPAGVIGIDVDHYDDKRGADRLAELEMKFGPLPPTWMSTSRPGTPSGIRFYRVPVGVIFDGAPSADIDFIQRHHRYAVVWPSIHPEGRPVLWFNPSGIQALYPPDPEQLPDLPEAWVQAFRVDRPKTTTSSSGTGTGSTSSRSVNAALGHYLDTRAGGRHDAMTAAVLALVRLRSLDYPGADHALDVVRGDFLTAVNGSRSDGEAEREWDRAVRGAETLVASTPSDAPRWEPRLDPYDLLDDSLTSNRVVDGAAGAAPGPGPTATTRRHLTLTPASSIEPRPVRWLWEDRVAVGTLALLGGREGIGKSMVAYQLSADLTRGRLPGAHVGQQRAVIVCATEDSWEHTIVPRLMAADADLDRVFRVDVTTSSGVTGTLSLPADLAELEVAVPEVGAALIVLDPLLSRLAPTIDSHKDAEVRLALEPLVGLADRTGAALLGLIHLNKGPSLDPLTMLMASRAFAAVARSVLFLAVAPDDETGRVRYLGQPKNNLGSTNVPLLSLTIEPTKVADHAEGEVWTGRIVWGDDDPRTIAEVLRTPPTEPANDTAVAEAAAWLTDFLTIVSVASSETVRTEGKGYGHSERTLKRAREHIGAGMLGHGFPRRTFWSRPGMTPDAVKAWLDDHDDSERR